ncbi:hypothetical protein LCGC14_0745900 [marine sediment metagenome]|uniref:Uncharacterized protein n=1 Tax=marine sediment metagenome TaxID=412755 RepID=A0A0F9SQG5_9ZZZZ
MDEKEMLEAMKNCFSGFTQGGSCCGPSGASISCDCSPAATEEATNVEKDN